MLFSFNPQQTKPWLLEKIYSEWNNQCPIDDYRIIPDSDCLLAKISSFMQETSYILPSNTLIPIEQKPNDTTLWWNHSKKRFYHVPTNKNGAQWDYLGETKDGDGYFFDSQQSKLYHLLAHKTMAVQSSHKSLAVELAIRSADSLLLRPAYKLSKPFSPPSIKDVTNLNLQLTNQSHRVLLTTEHINHYQNILISLIHGMNTIVFYLPNSSKNEFLAFSREQDIIISHTSYSCRVTLLNAMLNEKQAYSFKDSYLISIENSHFKTQENFLDLSYRLKTLPSFLHDKVSIPILTVPYTPSLAYNRNKRSRPLHIEPKKNEEKLFVSQKWLPTNHAAKTGLLDNVNYYPPKGGSFVNA